MNAPVRIEIKPGDWVSVWELDPDGFLEQGEGTIDRVSKNGEKFWLRLANDKPGLIAWRCENIDEWKIGMNR